MWLLVDDLSEGLAIDTGNNNRASQGVDISEFLCKSRHQSSAHFVFASKPYLVTTRWLTASKLARTISNSRFCSLATPRMFSKVGSVPFNLILLIV